MDDFYKGIKYHQWLFRENQSRSAAREGFTFFSLPWIFVIKCHEWNSQIMTIYCKVGDNKANLIICARNKTEKQNGRKCPYTLCNKTAKINGADFKENHLSK